MTKEATVDVAESGESLNCSGNWSIKHLKTIEKQFKHCLSKAKNATVIDCTGLTHLDSAGAWLLRIFIQQLSERVDAQIRLTGLTQNRVRMFNLVSKITPKVETTETEIEIPNVLYRVGLNTMTRLAEMMLWIGFMGEMAVALMRTLFHPTTEQWRSILSTIDETGYRAIPIVSLMAFLIGVVLAYQLGTELRVYGANIYVVDVTGIAILREFAPLITAVIMAGRTSTSFAALIGTMVVNEEIDALQTMGVAPIDRLVVPRLLGMIIALPLLTVGADIFGVMGSMFMSKSMLDVSFGAFLERFEEAVALKHYILGLIKTPFFASVIVTVGCYQGFRTKGSADSVGKQTTHASVQSIFLIILADAIFSIIYNALGL